MGADFEDRADFENADRGFVASLDPMVIKGADGAPVHHLTSSTDHADVPIALTRAQLVHLLATGSADGAAIDGDAGVLGKLIGLLDEPDPNFAVVTP